MRPLGIDGSEVLAAVFSALALCMMSPLGILFGVLAGAEVGSLNVYQ